MSDSLLQPSDLVAEISVEDFTKILRATFSIYAEPVPGKAYAVRYTGSPYDHSQDECRSLVVYAHAKGTIFSPLVIFSVLSKFDISVPSYNEAVAGHGKLIQMKPPISAKLE